jgi:catechol 2,3-dioxygenase-like lactoylglutathione lyase family enzyme
MSLAHLTLATRDVEKTASFFEATLGYHRDPIPANVVDPAVWLNVGNGQQIHLIHVDGFEVSPFEREFGRHVAVFFPRARFPWLKQAIVERGGAIIEPLRDTPFERLFFREPVNGYVFEVIDQDRAG